MNALKIAATGMAAQQMRVDVISNNIANMSTTAYQPRVAEFADLVYQQYQTPGTLTSQTGSIVPAGICQMAPSRSGAWLQKSEMKLDQK